MIPAREVLLNDGEKICVLLNKNILQEVYCLDKSFYLIENLERISKTSPARALTIYLHPDAKDRIKNPQEIFSGEIEAAKNIWSKNRVEVQYKSKDNLIFDFNYDYKTAPKITVINPGRAYSDLICTITQLKTFNILSYNSEFFKEEPTKSIQKISPEEALALYTDRKATNRTFQPANFFNLTTISSEDVAGVIKQKFESDTKLIFELIKSKDELSVNVIKRGLALKNKQHHSL